MPQRLTTISALLVLAATDPLAPAARAQGIASAGVKPQARAKFSGRPWLAGFTDITQQAGLSKPTIYGGEKKVDYIVETSSGGLAFFDYDGDGFPDLFTVTGSRFNGAEGESQRLYRNRRDGTFEDVTLRAGLIRGGWQSGAAVADVDGDGRPDLLVTSWGELALWRNNGDGTFEDVSAASGLKQAGSRWWSGASFLDYDRDGDLDLVVSVYIDPFDVTRVPKPGANPNCSWKGLAVACGPRGLSPGSPRLFRNERGKFVPAELPAARCFGMTTVAADFDDDGWTDIYIACDSMASLLFINQKNGRFREEGIERGVALNEDGREQAGMGLGIGDYNLDGRLDLFKTHFADDTHMLYRNDGAGQFTAVTQQAGLAVETRYVGWGAAMADLDHDGFPDIFFVNGNVYPETETELPAYPYLSPARLYRNLDGQRFEQIADIPALNEPRASRGLAAADIDNDGDLDLAIWNRNAPVTLLRNDLPATAGRHWLRVTAPTGTRVTAFYGAGHKQAREVLSQSSFYSVDDPRLHFGLGTSTRAELEIRWPDGSHEKRSVISVDREIRLTKPAPARR